MDNTKDVSNYSREECSEWLKNIGQCATGNVQELQIKNRKFMRYPRLVKCLEEKANKNYKFSCSLDPTDIPPTTAKWCKKDEDLPLINEDIFKNYCKMKTYGSLGQQEKAIRMLQSRKLSSWCKWLMLSRSCSFVIFKTFPRHWQSNFGTDCDTTVTKMASAV